MEPYETEKVGRFTIKLYPDEAGNSPRDWDNLGMMVCRHRDYDLGDEKPDPRIDRIEVLVRYYAGTGGEWFPLYLLDHSGLWLRTGTFACDSGIGGPGPGGGWDTSLVGIIYVTREQIIAEYGDDSAENRARAREVLQAEVKVYSQWLEGDVRGWVLEDADGNTIDSCWGYYDDGDALADARSEAAGEIERERVEKQERVKRFIKSGVPLIYRTA